MQSNQTVLHKACAKGDVVVVKILVESGASVDQKDEVRQYCFHDQCCVVYVNVVLQDWLLDMSDTMDTVCNTYC